MSNDADAPGHSQRLAGGHGYSPRYLAQKHRISTGQARDLIAEVGPDRERLNLTAAVVRRVSGR